MVLFKQAFACANTANCVAALEIVLWLWHILLDGDLGRISVGCVQKFAVSWLLAWKIEPVWMPLTTSVLTCFPPRCVLCHPPSGSLCSACAHWSPRLRAVALLDLWSQMLSSAAVHPGHTPVLWVTLGRACTDTGRKKSHLVSVTVWCWDSKWFWSGTDFITLEPVG